ncbi:hypothetical protein SUGI_0102250 [Cryptomeria japonica]|nr:hypothetical protein SUGI_0102250 [Cryptomeria japonica]
MGNVNSCFKQSETTVNLIRADGEMQRFDREITVKEIMGKYPSHFVCNLKSLKAGKRVVGLEADKKLKRGKFYLLLPLTKLNAPCSDLEISKVALKCMNSSNNWCPLNSEVTPVVGELFELSETLPNGKRKPELFELPKLWKEGDENQEEFELIMSQIRRRKSWKPMLDTIQERPPPWNTWKSFLPPRRRSMLNTHVIQHDRIEEIKDDLRDSR